VHSMSPPLVEKYRALADRVAEAVLA